MTTTGPVKNISDEEIRLKSEPTAEKPSTMSTPLGQQHIIEKRESPVRYFLKPWLWIQNKSAGSVEAVQIGESLNLLNSRTRPVEILSVAPGLADKYKQLFVNRLSYSLQSEHDHRCFVRPRHEDLVQLAIQKAAVEMRRSNRSSASRADEIYEDLVKEFNLPGPYLGLTEEAIDSHLKGKETLGLYAINPSTQRCRWILFDAKSGTEAAERDLTKLQLELSKENVFAIQEEKGQSLGGRLWIFCGEPLPASQCRLLAYNLALRTGIPISAPGFDSEGIDIFPRQESVRNGELGEAILAPLGIADRNANVRYWFRGNFPKTLEAQLKALCKLPKLTAKQLDGLTSEMRAPAQWETQNGERRECKSDTGLHERTLP